MKADLFEGVELGEVLGDLLGGLHLAQLLQPLPGSFTQITSLFHIALSSNEILIRSILLSNVPKTLVKY